MSRSNPTQAGPSNPSTRFFEWKGGEEGGGRLGYYDKEKEVMVEVKPPFTFLFLDQMATVKGYCKKRKCGLYANEVRSTQLEPLKVRFHGEAKEMVAEGLWSDIKDVVTSKNNGGGFCANVYIAYKGDDGKLQIGSIAMTGSALGPWFDFQKKNRKEMHEKAITISRGPLNDSGSVSFYPPVFEIKETSKESSDAAIELDKQLQTYLDAYLSRGSGVKPTAKTESEVVPHAKEKVAQPPSEAEKAQADAPPEEDDVPF